MNLPAKLPLQLRSWLGWWIEVSIGIVIAAAMLAAALLVEFLLFEL